MDATCNVQDSIHVFHLVHNMCPGFWVHIKVARAVIRFDACFDRSEINSPFHKVALQFLLERLSQWRFDHGCPSK